MDLPVVTVPDEWRDPSPDPRWLDQPRCSDCGRFARVLYDVPCNPPTDGYDRSVCEPCGRRVGAVYLPSPDPRWLTLAPSEETR